MLASNSSFTSLSSLVSCRKCLKNLLQKAKSREGSICRINDIENKTEISSIQESESIHEEVKGTIDGLLEYSNMAQDSVLKESMANVMGKLEGILQEFIKIDEANATSYRELAEKVKDFISKWQQSSALISSSSAAAGDSSQHDSQEPEESHDHISESTYENLTDDEKQFLLCFSLFPDGIEIKKRDLIFWWIGMGSECECSDGDQVLKTLVEKGFIHHHLVRNKKLRSNRYRMSARLPQTALAKRPLKATQEGFFSVMHYVNNIPPANNSQQLEREKIQGLLNIDEKVFNSTTFDKLFNMKNAKVVQLGRQQDMDKDDFSFTVIQDVESLHEVFKILGQVKFLGLQGISGIVKLPDSVCRLENLKVLDLRACYNLEFLPQGIGSLQKLTHLDLSECFLLDHIPKEIATLSNLTVLKGFVISPDPNNSEVVGRNDNRDSSSCAFSDLKKLKQLKKLSIRTRRMNFPTRQDLQTLCQLQHLNTLIIAWVGSPNDAQTDSDLERFPETVQKLEFQTAPMCTASQLLGLISSKLERDSSLEKLYIKGGGLRELDPETHYFAHVKAVRLRYLFKLDMDWDQFVRSFPKLTSLEVFQCPNLAFFPCDENGSWAKLPTTTDQQ